jgi:phospholipase/carboxylesterase
MTSEALLDSIEIDPPGRATAAVIWLHGLGDTGHGHEPIVRQLSLPPSLGIRFVLPHAPPRPITLNGGMVMPGWYDVLDLELQEDEDERGIRDAEEKIAALIRREIGRGIPAARIALAGFSQGGAIALQAGLRFPERLAGLLVFSAYLPLAESAAEELSDANHRLRIFMAHGTADDVIPLEAGELSRSTLEAMGYRVDWREYPMAHSMCPEEIDDVAAWLEELFGA